MNPFGLALLPAALPMDCLFGEGTLATRLAPLLRRTPNTRMFSAGAQGKPGGLAAYGGRIVNHLWLGDGTTAPSRTHFSRHTSWSGTGSSLLFLKP